MASKSSDVRPKITLACMDCKERNYITKKNRRNDPDRMELKKFCPRCRTHTASPRDPLTAVAHRHPHASGPGSAGGRCASSASVVAVPTHAHGRSPS